MAFSLNSYPVVYRAQYRAAGRSWTEEYLEKTHRTQEEEAQLSETEAKALADGRNFYADMPLVSYTSQYGMGCFEGLKALPQKDGGLAVFRPDRNAARFFNSMKGLYMPPFPEEKFLEAVREVVRRNAALGFRPAYRAEWEKDGYLNADSVYIRPFANSEGGIGVNLSREPWVIVVATTVSSYFSPGKQAALVTDRIRATPKGTGWIKTAANYVTSALAKHEAAEQGFVECIFLDAAERKYIEEGSSCNVFFRMKSGELATPELGDTILPGITRASIIELARDQGVAVSERKIAIDEVMDQAVECFLSGTAAGATPVTELSYNGKRAVFNGGREGDLTAAMRGTLKGIQYGALPDTKGWMVGVA